MRMLIKACSRRGGPAAIVITGLLVGMATARAAAPEPRTGAGSGPDHVLVLATPGGGIQPQALIDEAGAIHLISFQGPPTGGDLVYVRIEPGQTEGGAPIRINSQPGTATAMGTIRGGQVALGREGRVHVAWNGTPKAQPANPFQGAPMLYTRSNPERTVFEPQRNLMQRTYGLDGGGTVAADGAGSVYVAWHGRTDEDGAGETGRRVWIARSRDEGKTFAPEEPISLHPTGACPCCGMKALADRAGHVDLLFRTATDGTERGISLLASRDRGETFRMAELHPWRLKACPMSSASLVTSPKGIVAAWETNGQVFFARIDPDNGASSPPVAPPGEGRKRKHPALAVNSRGEILLAWAEGTAWQRGGALAWQRFDSSGRPVGEPGRIDQGIPAWSLPTAVARPDGGFVVIH